MDANLGVVFLTGLTTGGLTCLAVQGGLLATALAQRTSEAPKGTPEHSQWMPIGAFLLAKLVVHIALGFWLGVLGSALRITPSAQGILQILVGILMLGSALNLLEVHPIFRYFAFQPPKRLTRLVRQQAKSDDWLAPAFLGMMTILIPCGTTQAMALLAISTGNGLLGAGIMGAFVLGTMPSFVGLGFIASQAKGYFQKAFRYVTAILVLILGGLAIDMGLVLLESPIVPSKIINSLTNPTVYFPAKMVSGWQEVNINVVDYGYTPNHFRAEAGRPIRLRMITDDTYSCGLAFMIPSLNIFEVLPNTGETIISLPPLPEGDLNFMCSMGMYTGVIRVEGA